jgi:hypothetical protein
MKNRMIKKLAKSGRITMLRVFSRSQKNGLELVPVVHGAEMVDGEINLFTDYFGQRRWFEIKNIHTVFRTVQGSDRAGYTLRHVKGVR